MEETTIGAVLFDGIEENPYLNELYDAILYNYGRQLFGLTNLPEKEISVPAALRFVPSKPPILCRVISRECGGYH